MNWGKLALHVSPTALAWGVFAAGTAIALLSWSLADQRIHQDADAKIDAAIADTAGAIHTRLLSTYDVMLGAQGLFRASDEVSREDFRQYVEGLNLRERHPSIRAVNYAPLVPAAKLPELIEKVRNDRSVDRAGYPGFAIRPPGERAEYMPVLYSEPSRGREPTFGLDLLAEERRESVERARDLNEPVLSGRLTLVSDPTRSPAVSVRVPVYRDGMPHGTVEERRAAFTGALSATLLVRDVVGDLLAHAALAPLAIRVYEASDIAGARNVGAGTTEYLLHDKAASHPFSVTDRDYFLRETPLSSGGRRWKMRFEGVSRDFMTPTDRALPWILLFGGIVVSALLAGLVRSLASSTERARKLASEITDDLRQSEARLSEMQRLTQSMIEALPNPIFFKGTDGCYLGVNKAWEAYFGLSRATFVGKTVHDLYPHDRALADRMDALDRELWRSPGSQSYEAVITTADGVRHDVVYYKATYARSDGAVAGLIGTIIDITGRKQAERRQAMEHAITRVLAEEESLDEAIPKIIRTICETMGWHYGDRYDYDADAQLLRRQEMWCIDQPEIRAFAEWAMHRAVKPDPNSQGLIRRTYATAAPVWIADVTKTDLKRRELIERAGLHGAFAFPLLANNQVLGVLEFFHRDVREPDAMLLQIAESIGRQIGQFIVRMQAEEAVKFVAMHDALTQLPNRVMFNQRLESAIRDAERSGTALAVMFIDLDRFKIINDTLGHESGDLLLREVAQRITDNLRTGDTVARLGGDEFVVLLEDASNATAVGRVAEKLISALTESYVIAGREVHVTASIGISSFPVDAQDMRSLLKFADIAMYRAKEQGRNTFQFYSDQFNVHSVERLTLESQLRGALERNELVVYYQPVVEAATGHISGMEALVRWNHPEVGLLSPGKFIEIAEETGLVVPIGAWVLARACEQQRKWVEQGLPPLRVAVNLSPRQFLHRHLIDDIVKVIRETNADTSCLELEITESTVMHNAQRAAALLSQLKEMGIRVAIDDFGTGYSSLAYLKRFPIDSLKIDRSFVADVPGDTGNTAITQAIMAMAHSLGLKVIAEGVESEEQLAFLRQHGCEELQGYYFSKPVTAEEATKMLHAAFAPPLKEVANG
ncbi:MAG TPA: EAL domain-containing protein [Burkholderiales bacterium]|nr:EAL domain-containing protein [Burkholderiales bacterium]